ncbi:hypothetical protein DB346_12815 [Verrucomicrobia bacterium LW23]|nr:hypothetical protein DB346_12815 [Verrucomicrobia bacterium LW23]
MTTHHHLVFLMEHYAPRALATVTVAEGGYELAFEDALMVQIFALQDSTNSEGAIVILTAVLGPVPEDSVGEALVAELMAAQYFPAEPQFLYALEPETGYAVTSSLRSLEALEQEVFEEWVSDFIRHASTLRGQLQEAVVAAGASRDSDGADDGPVEGGIRI